MMTTERKVFALRGNQLAGWMVIRETAERLEAVDSTGCTVGIAHYVRGTGWVVVKTTWGHQILSTQPNKPAAVTALQHLVGEQ